MLISDAVSLGLMAGGLACDSEHRALRETLFVYGALGYALGGPTIHVIHGEDKRAAGSFGIRLGAPVAVALATLPVAMVVARSGDSDASADPLTVGVIVLTAAAFSPLLAAAVDNLALARPHVEQPRPRWLPPRRSRPTLVLQPTFEVRRANAGLTLSGVW
jgi:hypothetical protein